MARGFVDLAALMDWYSGKIFAWRLSNSLITDFFIEAVEQAMGDYGKPEIFNTDQGSQFTSQDFAAPLVEGRYHPEHRRQGLLA